MGSLFSKPKTPKVEKPRVENQLAAAYAEAEKIRRRAGQASTVFTSMMGTSGPPNTLKATLG